MFLSVQTFGQYMGIDHFFTLIVLVKCFEYHETIAETKTNLIRFSMLCHSFQCLLTGKYVKLKCQMG